MVTYYIDNGLSIGGTIDIDIDIDNVIDIFFNRITYDFDPKAMQSAMPASSSKS